MRMATLRVVLALAGLEDLDLRSLDISNAFVNGELEEEVYMEQPDGFHFGNKGDVLRLLKALYGLKQAPRVWNRTLHAMLKKLGFIRLKSDASLYLYRRDAVRIIMPVFIDDITIASTDAAESDRLCRNWLSTSNCAILDPPRSYWASRSLETVLTAASCCHSASTSSICWSGMDSRTVHL